MYFRDITHNGIEPFENKVWLASPKMHGEEQKYVNRAFELNWITTAGENVYEVERVTAEKIGVENVVALSSGTASLHMAIRLAGEEIYGRPEANRGTLEGQKVFCTDMTFDATVNPVAYEGGEPVFIDTEYDTWNIDPVALEKAFEIYPEVKLVVVANLYGTPAKLYQIKAICDAHGAILIEDAAESLGALYRGRQTGTFGKYAVVSFNGNKIITGSSGGALLVDSSEAADKVRKWSTQAREDAPWYQHQELGYNYRMSNIIAGVVRGQYEHLEEHIAGKKAIFRRYYEGLKDLPISMNPFISEEMEPNYWLSCMLIDEAAMCIQRRGETQAVYEPEQGKTCPTEILEALASINAEGRPIWKPMHMQPIYGERDFITREGLSINSSIDVGRDIFERGLCLPSDINMTGEEQNTIIQLIRACFE